jgi:hypothetical protein
MKIKPLISSVLFLVLSYQTASAAAVTYHVYATREGLVGGRTSNGHIITSRDHFCALPSKTALNSNGGYTYTVTIRNPANGRVASNVPQWDIGPWNINDNYWHSPREAWTNLPRGTPEAQVAYQNGYNGGKDGSGRTVANPAGIDLADGTFWDDLGMVNNGWVDVTYNWEPATPPLIRDDYIGVLYQNGLFAAKVGANGTWHNEANGVSSFQLKEDKLGWVINGAFYTKVGLDSAWLTMNGPDITKFQLMTRAEGDRVGVLHQSGLFEAKDGWYNSWHSIAGSVTNFSLNGNRLGFVVGGAFYIKDGLDATWLTMNGPDIVKFQVLGDRIGALHANGLFEAKDGLYSSWKSVATGVSDFQFDGNRIGFLISGAFYVKDGIDASWLTMNGPDITKFQILGDRVGVLHANGTFEAKDGLYGSWHSIAGGVSSFQLDGDRLGFLINTVLNVKYGLDATWITMTGSGVTGFQLETYYHY